MSGAADSEIETELHDIENEFENIHLMLVTLAETSSLAIEADALPAHFSAGLGELYRHALKRHDENSKRLRTITAEVYALLRDERIPPSPANKPMLMRDQFIADNAEQGYSVGDISQALGLSSAAVERVIRRLHAKPQPEKREASV